MKKVSKFQIPNSKLKKLDPRPYPLNPSLGFTLVELLIVIAIIGVLAAIVIAALNPAEQIRRGNDARLKSQVNVVGNAAQAYFTAQGSTGIVSYPRTQLDMTASEDLKQEILTGGAGVSAYCGGSGDSCVVPPLNCPPNGCDQMITYAKMSSAQAHTQVITASGGTYSTLNCGRTQVYFVYVANATVTKAGFYCGGVPNPGISQFQVFY